MIVICGKNSELDKAKQSIARLQYLVYRFELELNDVGFRATPDVTQVRAADWCIISEKFFANLVTEGSLLSSLGDSLSSVVTSRTQSEMVIALLKQKVLDTRELQNEISAQWRETVESA